MLLTAGTTRGRTGTTRGRAGTTRGRTGTTRGRAGITRGWTVAKTLPRRGSIRVALCRKTLQAPDFSKKMQKRVTFCPAHDTYI